MKNRDRAEEALTKMTARAYHLKKVTKHIIENNRFTSQSVCDATGVPAANVARIVSRLIAYYGFIIDSKFKNGHYEYHLRDCVFDKVKMPENYSRNAEPAPLMRPIYLDPLWQIALAMKGVSKDE